MDAPNNGIILYHYSFSPFARRVTWYMALRGLDYAQCNQPVYLPRPDVNALGVNYRRIPLMAIGRDVYCDSRLILLKLERMFPEGSLGASDPEQRALQKLLEIWTVDTIFARAAQMIPTSMPLLNDPKFVEDRQGYTGRSWEKEQIATARPEAIVHIRNAFVLLETTLLADGREWVLKTAKPSLADIEAIWPFHWLNGMKDALPPDLISAKLYPKVFSWIGRFDKAIKAARSAAPTPLTLKGDEAFRRIIHANFADNDVAIDEQDPLGLKKGEEVEVWPIDTGFTHRDRGLLVGLNQEEVVLAVRPEKEGEEIRLHFPRTNFRVRAVKGAATSKL